MLNVPSRLGVEGAKATGRNSRRFDCEQFHFEDERGGGRDGPGVALFAVGELGRDGEAHFVAHAHLRDADIPALNHFAAPEGELKRVIAQRADISPAQIIIALNEYIFLTLSDQQFFATAVALRVQASGEITLCIAGHPPPMLRRSDGRVEAIDSTAAMLGPMPPADFTADEVSITLARDDALVLYTDGAMEVRNLIGRQFGLTGLKNSIAVRAATPMSATDLVNRVMTAVDAHRAGATEDDTLVVALARA